MKTAFKFLSSTMVALVVSLPGRAIASNTKSAVASEYIRSVTAKINRNWNPVRSKKDAAIKLAIKVHKDGSVSDLHIVEKPGDVANEERALAAIRKSAPFMAPPPALSVPVDIIFDLTCPARLNLTVAQALQLYGTDERTRLRQQCTAAGIVYPPKRITLLALKDRQQLLMFAGDKQLALVQRFPLTSYSGTFGPKLRQGDLQIPEGIYRITGSSAREMLSLAVDYPNAFDRQRALGDQRTSLGGEILIHGGSVSTGCLVVSNEQMQEIFIAAHDIGFEKVKLVISPCDLTRAQPSVIWSKHPKWLPELYEQLKRELSTLSIPAN